MTVFLHVGAPKTGTTSIQQLLSRSRGRLRAAGVCYPGTKGDHFDAARALLGASFGGLAAPDPGSWKDVADEASRWPGRAALISHELLTRAQPHHVASAMASLPVDDVEIVYTVRDLSRAVPAMWQESLKNRRTWTFDDYLSRLRRAREDGPGALVRQFPWFDAPSTLERWGAGLEPGKVHVIVLPQGGPPDAVWRSFAGILGVDPDGFTVPDSSNKSLGVVQAEFLRRLNQSPWMEELDFPTYHRLVKHQFAAQLHAASAVADRKIRIPDADGGWIAEWAHEQIARLEQAGYHVVGDLDDLLPSATAPAESLRASSEEVATLGVDAAAMLVRRKEQVRVRLTRQRRDRDAAPAASDLSPWQLTKRWAVARSRTSRPLAAALARYRRARAGGRSSRTSG